MRSRPEPRRRRRTSWARPLGLVRLVAVLIAVTFGWRVSLAHAFPCLHGEGADSATGEAPRGDGCCPGEGDQPDASHEEPRHDDQGGHDQDEDCPCPVDCGPCCGGALLHVLPSVPPRPAAVVTDFLALPEPGPPSRLSHEGPHDILHVPR